MKQVKQFCSLGSIITKDNRCSQEVKQRISLTKQAFVGMKKLLTNKNITVEVRKALSNHWCRIHYFMKVRHAHWEIRRGLVSKQQKCKYGGK